MNLGLGKIRILFLCTHNSCRSQMAEALARHFIGDFAESYSAGIEVAQVNPHVKTVLSEIGIDISNQKSKLINDLIDIDFDLVVTVCDNASENCPIFPKKVRIIHKNFKDPSKNKLTGPDGQPDLSEYRKIRDLIKEFVIELPNLFNKYFF